LLVGGVLKGYAKGGLDKIDYTGGDKDGVKYRDQQPFPPTPNCVSGLYFSELPPVDFREIGEHNQKHHRIFDSVDIGPEYPQKREKPNLVLLEFQDVEKNNNEKIGKEVRPHR